MISSSPMLSHTAMNDILKSCELCPRRCGADRTKTVGFCGGGVFPRLAKAYLHMWEEPCISGTRGSGTVFFSGCSLKCCFCQNYRISAENFGKEISVSRLAEIFPELEAQGAHNINLVSATHYVPQVIEALDLCKGRLNIPVAYNSGGYELPETIEMLRGYVNIFMPDFKYYDSEVSEKYSAAKDYFSYASAAIGKMIEMAGKPVYDENGLMKSGVIIRHMVLPSHRKDSEKVLRTIAEMYPKDSYLLSLMSQYTPFYKSCEHKEINRRISTYEYEKVAQVAAELEFDGFMQERSSAKEEYTPDFDLSGI